jgi:hypothetical protein
MAGKPAEPPHRDHRPVGAEPLATGVSEDRLGRADERELEHTGPIAIERYVKDDGRALILYFERRATAPPRHA